VTSPKPIKGSMIFWAPSLAAIHHEWCARSSSSRSAASAISRTVSAARR
jgi:hypothetical protein